MGIDWVKTAELLALIGLGLWNGYKIWEERRFRKMEEEYKLEANPGRCQDHAKKINQLLDDVKRIKEHLGIV